MTLNNTLITIICFCISNCTATIAQGVESTIEIPTAGNSWVISDIKQTSEVITTDGISNWSDANHIIRTYFYMTDPREVTLGINVKVTSGTSVIKATSGDQIQNITIVNTENSNITVMNVAIEKSGYYFLDLQGVSKEALEFAAITDVSITGTTSKSIKYIKDDFYFGRRGPSTHLSFDIPDEVRNVEWFYSEISIPKEQDIIGSYYMANGFGEGYFGIQVNSPTERRILFSIWSPYKTDNPDEIPEEFKIQLLKKGDDVITKKFGDEGSGGQSYKVYDWKTEVSYKFLIGVNPSIDDYTDYTAYFLDPEIGKWNLIASFRRPKTNTYLKRLYSFLENFIPNQGVFNRKGQFLNQWICDDQGKWHELTKATFTADQTAKKEARLDYSGGTENHGFYLKNFGFTSDYTKIGSKLTREPNGIAPKVKFELLE